MMNNFLHVKRGIKLFENVFRFVQAFLRTEKGSGFPKNSDVISFRLSVCWEYYSILFSFILLGAPVA